MSTGYTRYPSVGGGLTDPMTTSGDMISRNSSNTTARLPVGTLGQVLQSLGTTVVPTWTDVVSASGCNRLLNSDFTFWQRGTSITIANAATAYQADRWYAKNSLGTNGILTYSQVAGVTNGSPFGAKLQITTAPTAAQTNGTELYQVLENADMLQLYNQTASFGILVKSFGNVTQVGVQFFYATTETKLTTAIGSEVLTTVSTGSFTRCIINGQALGTAMTTSGVVGVRIRITGVSSGNLYDLNNGFVVEQAQLNLGSYAAPWSRCTRSTANEIQLLERYYEKSYDVTVSPGTNTSAGAQIFGATNAVLSNVTSNLSIFFSSRKRISPTVHSYAIDGTIDTATAVFNSTDAPTSYFGTGQKGFSVAASTGASTGNDQFECQWTADAEI